MATLPLLSFPPSAMSTQYEIYEPIEGFSAAAAIEGVSRVFHRKLQHFQISRSFRRSRIQHILHNMTVNKKTFICARDGVYPRFRLWSIYRQCLSACTEVLALKQESRIIGQWYNHVSGSRKSHVSFPWAKQHRV